MRNDRPLTQRQVEFIENIIEGKTIAQTARAMDISTRTAMHYSTAVQKKMNADSLPQLAYKYAQMEKSRSAIAESEKSINGVNEEEGDE